MGSILTTSNIFGRLAAAAGVLLLSSCDGLMQTRFDHFCKNNIPPLPAEKIATKGIEFRGDFGLTGFHSWDEFADYVEFSRKDIGVQSPSYSEFRIPSLLEHPQYRMELFEDWQPECRQYWVLVKAPEILGEEFFQREIDFMKVTPDAKCQGIFPVDGFEAEHIVERIDNPNHARISDRNVFARILSVTNRQSGERVAELHLYYMSSPAMFQGLTELPQGYTCASIEGSRGIYVDDLKAVFAPLE